MKYEKDSLGTRIKENYENVYRTRLPGRLPVIIRVDGRSFSSYTKDLKRPWDDNLNTVMDITAKTLCEDIQGAQIAYIQSDEISILIHGYKKLTSQAYFDGNVQKIASVTAGIASATFTAWSWMLRDPGDSVPNKASLIRPAYFDSRVFVLPESEVCNCFGWRQQDATRNSVQMLARSLYSHAGCTDKNNSQLQEMCFQKGHNWNDLPTRYKRGRCIVKQQYEVVTDGVPSIRNHWVVDNDIPIFFQEREYINELLYVDAEEA